MQVLASRSLLGRDAILKLQSHTVNPQLRLVELSEVSQIKRLLPESQDLIPLILVPICGYLHVIDARQSILPVTLAGGDRSDVLTSIPPTAPIADRFSDCCGLEEDAGRLLPLSKSGK
jgi:hypothetical protein